MMLKNSFSFLIVLVFAVQSFAGDPIPVGEIKRAEPVDFDKEILPVLRQNCLACHNSTDAEGDVILENVSTIIDSEAVVPGKPKDSSLLQLSAHNDDPVMPPEDNEVKAKNMTSQQLGLINLWILQGAKPSAVSTANKVEFAKLPKGVNPVYAMAMSQNGQFLAAGRANQIFVYQVPSKKLLERVTDPSLLKSSPYNKPGVAHLDIVQSLAFSPDNQTFVSGGFRNVKIWKKAPNTKSKVSINVTEPISLSIQSNNRSQMALGGTGGSVFVLDCAGKKLSSTLKVSDKAIDSLAIQNDALKVAFVTEKRKLALFDVAAKKAIGNPIPLEADAVAVTFIQDNTKVLVSLANNTMLIYPLTSFSQDPKDKIAPEKKLSGHSKPVLLLRPFGDKDSKLATASDDGTAKIWNLANGQQVRTFTHSGPICNLEVSTDESRIATCGKNGSLKIFNAANSSLVKEVRGDVQIDFQNATNDRLVRRHQLLINAAKADLDAATKEKTAEDANVKKTEETLKKSDEDLKKKLEVKTKADAAVVTATKPLDAKKAELATLTKTKTDLEGKIKTETDKQKKANDASAPIAASLQKATADKTNADKALTAANANLAKEPAKAELKTAVDAAKQLVAKTDAALKVAQQNKTKNDADKTAVAAQLKTLNTQKVDADKKITAATNEVKKQEANLKKLTDAQKKATDEHTASQRNQTLSKNSVDRAKVRAKNAADKIPVLDGKHKAATAAKTAQEKLTNDFKTANASKLNVLTGMTQLSNGTLAYRNAEGQVGRCDFNSGEKIDSPQLPEAAKDKWFSSFQNDILSLSADGKTINVLAINDGWNFAKSIGNIDDTKTFVDRVTAIDISADGKFLATGSGEPSRSGEIKVWSLPDGKLVKEFKDAHSDTILDLKFSPDGTKIASGSSDRFMKTFDVKSGKMIRVFEGHTHHVMSVDWNSIGRDLSSAGADKVVKVWDAETGTQKRTISGYGKEVTSLSFVELSNNIITTSGDKTVRLKRTDNGGELRQFAGNGDFVYTVATTADGKKFAAGGEDSVVRIWTDNGQVFVEFPAPKE